VIPTRHGRNHQAMTQKGSLNLRNLEHAGDPGPLEEDCTCYTCSRYSRAYLRHLSVAREMLAAVLLTIHNLHHYQELMVELRREAEG
jgi:queuine tRNA-ribosyltransferase